MATPKGEGKWLKPKDMLSGRYEILKEIGVGGMSRVFLAMDISINKQWAVKQIDKNSAEYKATVNENQTLNEIEILKSLDHPALPRITEVIDDKDSIYVVMDYIEGETLSKIIEVYGRQDQELVSMWIIQVLDILEYLHGQNPPIIYRDIKPSNLMLKPDGNIKIIDFGVARTYKEGKDDTICFGTRGYASPEHFTKKTDERSDIYSVGSTMHHLLTGLHPSLFPFDLPDIRSVDENLSSGLEEIIVKATRHNPKDRYQSASEMMQAVANYKKLELPYIRSLEKKVKTFRNIFAAAFLSLALSASFFITDSVIENNTYDALLSSQTPNKKVRIADLTEAISVKPERKDAYISLIKEYSKDGFTEDEATDFFSIYNRNKAKLNERSKDYAELNFEIGKAFLIYYTGSSDNSTRNKLINAKSFFEAAMDIDFEEKTLSEGYYKIATFYEEYIISTSSLISNEPEKEDSVKLLSTLDNMLKLKAESGEELQLKLVTVEAVLSIIDEQRSVFAETGVVKENLCKIIDLSEEELGKIDSSKTHIQDKKERLIGRIKGIREKVEMSYENKEKRGDLK